MLKQGKETLGTLNMLMSRNGKPLEKDLLTSTNCALSVNMASIKTNSELKWLRRLLFTLTTIKGLNQRYT